MNKEETRLDVLIEHINRITDKSVDDVADNLLRFAINEEDTFLSILDYYGSNADTLIDRYWKNGNIIVFRRDYTSDAPLYERGFLIMGGYAVKMGNHAGCISKSSIRGDLTTKPLFDTDKNSIWDIMEVYQPSEETHGGSSEYYAANNSELIWERAQKVRMSVSEVEDALNIERGTLTITE